MDTLKFLKSIEKKLTINPVVKDNKAYIFFKDDLIVVNNQNLVNGNYGILNGNFTLIEKDENVEITDYYTDIIKLEKDTKITLTEEVSSKIALASKFAGNDELRPVMMGVYIDNYNIVATDAHKLFLEKHNIDIDKDLKNGNGFLIKHVYAKFFKGDETISFNTSGCVIETNDITIYCKSDYKYVNYEAVIPKCATYTKFTTFTKQKVKEFFDTAKKLNKEETFIIINDNTIEIENKSGFDIPNYKEEFNFTDYNSSYFDYNYLLMPYNNSDGKNGLNVKFLNEIASNYDSVKVYFNEDINKALLIQGIKSKKHNTVKKTVKKPIEKNNDMNDILEKLLKQNELLMNKVNELEKQIKNPTPIEKLCPQNAEEKEVIEKQIVKNDTTNKIDVVDYSEKALALFGEETKNNKEYIKEVLRGRFNPHLKNQSGESTPGWIISKNYKDKLDKLNCNFI